MIHLALKTKNLTATARMLADQQELISTRTRGILRQYIQESDSTCGIQMLYSMRRLVYVRR